MCDQAEWWNSGLRTGRINIETTQLINRDSTQTQVCLWPFQWCEVGASLEALLLHSDTKDRPSLCSKGWGPQRKMKSQTHSLGEESATCEPAALSSQGLPLTSVEPLSVAVQSPLVPPLGPVSSFHKLQSESFFKIQSNRKIASDIENVSKLLRKFKLSMIFKGFPSASVVKNLSAMQEMQVQSLDWEDPLEEEMATHSSTLVWKIKKSDLNEHSTAT